MTADPCLSVVMPCYNESATLLEVARRVLDSPFTRELLIVDDGSTDDTLSLAQSLQDPRVQVFSQSVNQGKGAALRRGFREATSPFVLVQDADLEYDPEDYATLLEPLLEDKADVVYGSRFMGGRPHRVLYYWHSVGNRLLTMTSNMFTNLNLTDMETCYKAFRREVLQAFTIEEDRFGFEPEITAKVARGGWRLYEVGVSYAGRTYAEGKKIGWRDGVHAVTCIVRYSGAFSRLAPHLGISLAPSAPPAPVTFDAADAELAEVLDSLDGAENYADWILALLEPFLGKRILEVGAGRGVMTSRLIAHGEVTATDLSDRCVQALTTRFSDEPRVRVERASIDDVEPGEDYDAIVVVNVLEHILDDEGAMRSMAAAVRPGGHILVYVPAFPRLYSDFDRRIGHHRRYTRAALLGLAQTTGVEVADIRYVNSVGALAWWVMARKLGRTPTTKGRVAVYDKAAVPVLRRLEARFPPPVGQSLLCAFRRPVD